MEDYTIMEYNVETHKYVTIGHARGKSSADAKRNFLKKDPWKPRLNVMLFAKIPICR